MGNQQEILNEELAYLAGILDGEGSITMNVRRKTWKGWNGIGVDIGIAIVNTDGGIIKRCVEIIRKIGIEPYLNEQQTQALYKRDGTEYRNKLKTLVYVRVGKMAQVKRVLELIAPYLAGEKKSRAELMIEFIDRRMSHKGERTKHGSSWYEGYDWYLVKQFYDISGGKLPTEVQAILNDYTPEQLSAA